MSTSKKRIRTGSIAALVSLGLFATACSSGEEDGEAAGTTQVVWAVQGASSSLDAAQWDGLPTGLYRQELYSTLTVATPPANSDGCDALWGLENLGGNLAESWVDTKDGKGVEITLAEGFKTPGGSELTAADVEFSLQRASQADKVAASLMGTAGIDVKNPVTVKDDRTVVLNLVAPNVLAMPMLSLNWFNIMDKETVEAEATSADPWAVDWVSKQATAYFGPWQVTAADFSPGEQAVFTPNANYPGERGNIEKLIVRSVDDPGTRTQLLRSGDADFVNQISQDQAQSLKDVDGLTVRGCTTATRDLLLLNQKDPILKDVDVRRAIALGIDREAIIAAAYQGFGEPSVSGISSAFPHELPEQQFSFDREQARELLAKAGHADGFEMTLLTSSAKPGPWIDKVATLVQADLAEIGIKVSIQNVASSAALEEAINGGEGTQAWLFDESAALPEPGYAAGLLNAADARQNWHGYDDKRFNEIVTELRATPVGADRSALVSELDQVMMETLPAVYLADRQQATVHASDIEYKAFAEFGSFVHLAERK